VETLDRDVRNGSVCRERQNVEDESGSESRVAREGVAQEEAIGLEGVMSKQETTDSDGEEAPGAFEGRGSGVTAFSRTAANKQAGDVACDQALIEIGKQMGEALVGPATVVREQVDEGIENDETCVDPFDGVFEAGKVQRESEGTVAGGVR
jgi:hypothetical protein